MTDQELAQRLAQEFNALALREKQDSQLAKEVAKRERRGQDADGLEAVDGGRVELERIREGARVAAVTQQVSFLL